MSEWHNGKPKESGDYLVTVSRTNIDTNKREIFVRVGQYDAHRDIWYVTGVGMGGCTVLAWRTLPRPWEEDI